MVSHKSCKDLFPNNCGLDEGQFAATLKAIGIDPKTIRNTLQDADEKTVAGLLSRPSSVVDEASVSRRSIIESIDLSMKTVRSRESTRQLLPKECSVDDFKILSMIGGGSFGKVVIVTRTSGAIAPSF